MNFVYSPTYGKVMRVDNEDILQLKLYPTDPINTPNTTILTIPSLSDKEFLLVNESGSSWDVGIDVTEGLTLNNVTSNITIGNNQSITLRYDKIEKNFIVAGRSESTGGGGGGAVDSVNGQTGTVILTKANIELGNVDNTSDANKPVSSTQQTAIDGKVQDTIVNGVTTIAPSQNAVFDALVTKQDSLGFTPEVQVGHLDSSSNVTVTTSTGNLLIRNTSAGSINLINSGTTINGSGTNFIIPLGKYASLHRDPSDNTKYIAEVIDITSSDVTFAINSDNQYTISQRGNIVFRDNFLSINFSQRNAVGLTYDLPNPASNAPLAWYIYNDRVSTVTIRDSIPTTITTIPSGEGRLFFWTASTWKVIGSASTFVTIDDINKSTTSVYSSSKTEELVNGGDPVGEVINEQFANLTNFTDYGTSGASVSGGKVTLTHNSTLTVAKGLRHNFAVSMYENHKVYFTITAGTIDANSYGIGLNFKTPTTWLGTQHNLCVRLVMATGSSLGKIAIHYHTGSVIFASAVSDQALSNITIGDVFACTAEFIRNQLTVTVNRIVSGNITETINYTYIFPSSIPASFPYLPTARQYCLAICGGTHSISDFRVEVLDRKKADVVFVGDSITKGTSIGATMYDRFSDVYAKQTGLQVVNYSAPGSVISGIDVANLHALAPKKIVICIGTNDVEANINVNTDYTSLINTLTGSPYNYVLGTSLFLMNLNARNSVDVRSFNTFQKTTWAPYIVDIYGSSWDKNTTYGILLSKSGDGTHPNKVFNIEIATQCISRFNNTLSKEPMITESSEVPYRQVILNEAYENGTEPSITGFTSTQTLLREWIIPANTFRTNDFIEMWLTSTYTGSNNSRSLILKTSTVSGTISNTGNDLATRTTTSLTASYEYPAWRFFYVTNSFIIARSPSSGFVHPLTDGSLTQVNFDKTVDQYFQLWATQTTSTDTVKLKSISIRNLRP